MQVELPSHSHVTGDVTQTIYIFCCTQEGCAARADSWRAFKQTSPQPGSLTEGAQGRLDSKSSACAALSASASAATEPKQHMQPDWSAAPETDTWGLSSNEWGSSAGKPEDSDFLELNSALDQLSMRPPPSLQVAVLDILYCLQNARPSADVCQDDAPLPEIFSIGGFNSTPPAAAETCVPAKTSLHGCTAV